MGILDSFKTRMGNLFKKKPEEAPVVEEAKPQEKPKEEPKPQEPSVKYMAVCSKCNHTFKARRDIEKNVCPYCGSTDSKEVETSQDILNQADSYKRN